MAKVKHTKAQKAKIRRRRVRQIRGALFLALALVGVLSIGSFIIGRIRTATNEDQQKTEYARMIAPLVAVDPVPFESIDKAKTETLEEAAIRSVVYNENTSKYLRTADNMLQIPAVDVDRYFKKMFGSGKQPFHTTFTVGEMTYEYDSDTQCFVFPFSNLTGTYYPRISNMDSSGSTKILTVDYISYADQGVITGIPGDDSGVKVTKRMEYVLLKESGEYHIYSVKYYVPVVSS